MGERDNMQKGSVLDNDNAKQDKRENKVWIGEGLQEGVFGEFDQ